MSRHLKINFSEIPDIKIRTINKNDSYEVTKSKKKYPFILCKDLRVTVEEEGKLNFYFEIPENYIWNGADIPKICFIFGQSKDNNYLNASMVHDYMLEKKEYIYNEVLKKSIKVNEYRKLTSLIFRQILKDEKTNTIKANCMSFAVDIFQMLSKRQWSILKEC